MRSTAFLPLGSRTERVGALFLHARLPREFSALDKLSLEAFASLVAEQIIRERTHWRKYEAFGGVLFGVHGPLTLSADSLRRLTGTARETLRSDPATAEAALEQAGRVARKLELAAMLTRLSQRDQLEASSLYEEMRRAAAKIVQADQPADRLSAGPEGGCGQEGRAAHLPPHGRGQPRRGGALVVRAQGRIRNGEVKVKTLKGYKSEIAVVLTLLAASALCGSLVVARAARTGEVRFWYMLWNLFLAWIPMACALAADQLDRLKSGWRHIAFALCAGVWLLFFPNAPYVLTDFLHLRVANNPLFWFDLILLLAFGWTSLLLGFISLYLMQDLVSRSLGRVTGWLFVLVTLALSSFGIYLGRFLRWNSWDVFTSPLSVLSDVWHRLSDPLAHPQAYGFSLLFAVFSLSVYLVLFTFTSLKAERRRVR